MHPDTNQTHLYVTAIDGLVSLRTIVLYSTHRSRVFKWILWVQINKQVSILEKVITYS
jgi:hypothetical protein